eukprot:Stramenopile-MAST_4_protein_142
MRQRFRAWIFQSIALVVCLVAIVCSGALQRKDGHASSNAVIEPKEKVDIFGVAPGPAPCTESEALKECNVMCMCLLMVNRQVGLWSKIFPTTEGKYLRGDVKPLSQCELWRDKKHTAEPLTVESRCFDKCTIAEQYVLAAHGWDPKVCARAKAEADAYMLYKIGENGQGIDPDAKPAEVDEEPSSIAPSAEPETARL